MNSNVSITLSLCVHLHYLAIIWNLIIIVSNSGSETICSRIYRSLILQRHNTTESLIRVHQCQESIKQMLLFPWIKILRLNKSSQKYITFQYHFQEIMIIRCRGLHVMEFTSKMWVWWQDKLNQIIINKNKLKDLLDKFLKVQQLINVDMSNNI
jgi:hypothetical protein